MNFQIEKNENTISVTADYNDEFVKVARTMGGKWHSPSWVFDIREEDLVRSTCLKIYGTDGVNTDLVDVQITLNDFDAKKCAPIVIFGKTVARAFGRDSGAKIGTGIVIKSGKFGSGGSAKNWLTTAENGTSFIMRDVSRSLVEANIEKSIHTEIISETDIDIEALKAEKEKLIARLAEIENLLTT
jgi:hypothetical protein